jgi:PIN domain nuclease of toxin-antitoxin system
VRLLLDTHVFLWFITGAARLRPEIRDVIRAPENDVALSVASLWEILVKHRLGKLPLPGAPEVYIPEQRARHGIADLPIEEASVARLAQLPPLHRDPFDRILVCQALEHGRTLVTVDPLVRGYAVPVL